MKKLGFALMAIGALAIFCTLKVYGPFGWIAPVKGILFEEQNIVVSKTSPVAPSLKDILTLSSTDKIPTEEELTTLKKAWEDQKSYLEKKSVEASEAGNAIVKEFFDDLLTKVDLSIAKIDNALNGLAMLKTVQTERKKEEIRASIQQQLVVFLRTKEDGLIKEIESALNGTPKTE